MHINSILAVIYLTKHSMHKKLTITSKEKMLCTKYSFTFRICTGHPYCLSLTLSRSLCVVPSLTNFFICSYCTLH